MANLQIWCYPDHHASLLFLSHLHGLEGFTGKVLEIGGTDETNLGQMFRRFRADYTDVRLEPNRTGGRSILSMDFMDLRPPDGIAFDMIISLGVFEEGGIDRNSETSTLLESGVGRRSAHERLAKLSSLLSGQGYCVIGTISDQCIFREADIRSAGFLLEHRMAPFNSFMLLQSGPYLYNDPSELLVLKKPG